MEDIKEPGSDWRLQKIELEFQSYGEDRGKYKGKISFRNGNFESFVCDITPEMAQPYIDLIAERVVESASSLGQNLIKSLGLEQPVNTLVTTIKDSDGNTRNLQWGQSYQGVSKTLPTTTHKK